MTESVFSRGTTVVLVVVAALSLLAGFAAAIFLGSEDEVQSSGADTFSTSAIGHGALVELLEQSGRRVVRSRGQSGRKAGRRALLLVLEPGQDGDVDDRTARDLTGMLERARYCLVALPKWRGNADPRLPGRVRSVDPVPEESVLRVAAAMGDEAELVRDDRAGGLSSPSGLAPSLVAPQLLSITGAGQRAVIAGDAGALLVQSGQRHDTSHWLLTDPDLLSNRGLGRGDNAALVLEILDLVAPRDRTILIDETLHGFAKPPDVWTELGRFPLVLVVAQVVLVLGFLLWAGIVRFGSPQREASGLRAGKQLLLDNTAQLLRLGGHSRSVLARYADLAERRVAAAHHLSPDLATAARRDRLQRIAAARGVSRSLDEVREAVQRTRTDKAGVEHRTLWAGRLVRQWWTEMLDGDR